jgi:hypothetical protein
LTDRDLVLTIMGRIVANRRLRLCLQIVALLMLLPSGVFAQSGFVKSAGEPIPGATVTVTQGSRSFSTVTDADGHYSFPPLSPGLWTVTVEMFGFEPLTKEVNYAAAPGPVNFELKLKESPLVARLRQFAAHANNSESNLNLNYDNLDQQLQATNTPNLAALPSSASTPNSNDNEAFLISGSLSPGTAQGAQPDSGPDMRFMMSGAMMNQTGAVNAPGFGGGGEGAGGGPIMVMGGGGFGGSGFGGGGFRGGPGTRGGPGGRGGRPPGGVVFGNRRRSGQIRGMLSFTLNNSALNAKPFSINGLDIPQAAYAQSRFSIIVGGPLAIPHLINSPKTQFFFTYFGTRARQPELFTETVPTEAERSGDFSSAVQSLGTSATNVPVTLFNPSNHQPFPGNLIPSNLLNPIALGLLRFYPLPNEPQQANNYQFETAQASNSDNIGLHVSRNLTNIDRLFVNFQYQDRNGSIAQPFGYSDTNSGYGANVMLMWLRNLTSTSISTLQLRFNRNVTQLTPYFSTVPDIAQQLGIPGVSTNPLDFGPPTLNFTNFSTLSDSTASLARNQTQGGTETIGIVKGTHSITLGGGYTRADLSTVTDPNGRGTFSFTGYATSALTGTNCNPTTGVGCTTVPGTGYDFADFLLGLPQSSSIRYGATANYFLQNQYVGFAQDEWKMRSNLTLIAGLRYEFFTPLTEKYGRMANLDIAPGFSNVAVVTPATAGPYTGAFPAGLINPDYHNWGPRVGLAWRVPWTKNSTIVRAGYGMYYNEQAYIGLARQLAQQPPFAISNAINTTLLHPLTLQQGFLTASPQEITNTFAVDRFYNTPYAATWNFTIQHDFGQGFFIEAGYLGTKGTHLDVSILPNQLPPGSPLALAQRTQLGNAVGFIYDEPVGNSIFNAFQLRAVRRFHRGLSFTAYYQFAKSIDDASSFGGIGNTVIQNWQDIEADRGLSSFDVRHELQTNFVWTSPIGGVGSRFASDSLTGRLLRDWTLSGGIVLQTGNPLTARVLGNTAQLAQTGGAGNERADTTGEPIESGPGFFNLAAFTIPPPSQWGDAGRNVIPGPGTFSINLAFGRSFPLSERRRIEFRVEGNNVLNHVNYTSLNTIVNSVNYGLPTAAGSMRTLDAVLRLRF